MLNSAVLVVSEIALALYPILIKRVPTDLFTQTFSRLITFSILAFSLASTTDRQQTWQTPSGITRSLLLGLLTCIHVGASYFAFEQLPAGVAMSLFYTYPILNLLGGFFIFGETITLHQIAFVLLAFVGVVLISQSITEGKTETPQKPSYTTTGIVAAFVAALTETLMYFGVRTAKQPNPYFATLELYPGALLPFGLLLLALQKPIDMNPSVWIPMTLFNVFVGFIGYALRFWTIPRVSTILFSMVAFIGVIASFLWGYLFAEETPTWMAMAGATLISVGVAFSNSSS